jgi:hypothetical protein
MSNHQSSIINHQLSIVLIAAVLGFTFLIGHYGLRPAIADRGAGFGAGRALENIPAPPESRLAGALNSAPGTGRLMVRYQSRKSAGAVAEFYRREMPARGWTTRTAPGMMDESGGELLAFADPTGSWCIISIAEAGAGGGSAVTLTRLASVPSPGAAAAAPKEESQ